MTASRFGSTIALSEVALVNDQHALCPTWKALAGRAALTSATADSARPDEVAEKIMRHSEALGGLSRISFQMNAASLPHAKLMRAIEEIGTRVAPTLRKEVEGKLG